MAPVLLGHTSGFAGCQGIVRAVLISGQVVELHRTKAGAAGVLRAFRLQFVTVNKCRHKLNPSISKFVASRGGQRHAEACVAGGWTLIAGPCWAGVGTCCLACAAEPTFDHQPIANNQAPVVRWPCGVCHGTSSICIRPTAWTSDEEICMDACANVANRSPLHCAGSFGCNDGKCPSQGCQAVSVRRGALERPCWEVGCLHQRPEDHAAVSLGSFRG